MDTEKQAQLDHANEISRATIPHFRALDLEVVEFGPKYAVLRLPYSERLVGNPETGVLHGGAITTLVDSTCGFAVFAAMERSVRIATLDLRIDYLRPATPNQAVFSRADCYRVARSVAFVRAIAYESSPDDLVASATGTFIITES